MHYRLAIAIDEAKLGGWLRYIASPSLSVGLGKTALNLCRMVNHFNDPVSGGGLPDINVALCMEYFLQKQNDDSAYK